MTRITRLRLAGCLMASGIAVASMTLAGCASGPAGGGSTASQGGGTPDDSTMAIVTCYRTHGDPSFPDPVYDPSDGRWHFATSPGDAPAATQQACQHLFPTANASPPVPQSQFQQLVRLAQCIRQHGVPTWPDPDPDGSYPLPPSLHQKTPADGAALSACGKYVPSGGIDVHAVP